MIPARVRPAYGADERTQLVGWLDMQRSIVHWKCEGLAPEDAHRAVLPGSPLMTMAGVVSHMRWVEHLWFEVVLRGGPKEGPRFEEGVEDADMRVAGIPLDRLLAEYEQQCAVSDAIIADHALDDVARRMGPSEAAPSLRWILFHMIEETARHAGHMDAMRELIDGGRGYY
ncbi:conserved hypothetical protein [Streptomyces himastatinicus ATCC 53653]|uniref:Mini-circle protein n=1 Tax=Streptomyces himastatinicus ATCC 53653 TaxID=457427 RepID=D9WW47_9ACTN|nr:DinB family protein [Streptomyces himastatinicus]EFL26503.1 conserved hypothetical protein [Streptomyces himastatinicus ATCC 53653]